MSLASQFRQALQDGDLVALRGVWATAMPHLPQPADDADAEAVMHRARTEAECVTLRGRAWSHRWLTERGLPSGLPDELKPRAERIRPRVIEAVGVSLNFRADWMAPAKPIVTKVVTDAIEDAYAGSAAPDPAKLRTRMDEVRAAEMRRLFGLRIPTKD
jgi:hypothetical protein